jgi:hypothetical protein
MTKGISTSERINKQGSRGRHGRLISDGLTSPPRWAADGQEEDPQRCFFPEQEQVKGWRRTGAGEGRQGKRSEGSIGRVRKEKT